MKLTYPGKLDTSVVGRVMGPDLFGALYEAVRAEYSPGQDVTHVEFRPLSRTDSREAVPDEFGELRVIPEWRG